MVKMIKLEDDVYQDLSSLGQFKETYNDIIKRLLKTYQKSQGGKK